MNQTFKVGRCVIHIANIKKAVIYEDAVTGKPRELVVVSKGGPTPSTADARQIEEIRMDPRICVEVKRRE
jgi:hypothetical protein